jgi:hypothetical protein
MSKHEAPPAVGGSSLLVIFAVLCLTIFALLSLSTVQADSRMAEASYKAVQDFYEADAEAERILAKLRQGDLPENVTNEGNLYRYTCRVSELQALEVEVEIKEASYRVLRWQMVSTTEWEADDSMNVWDGSME